MSSNHVLIGTIETTALTNYVTFSNIPQTGYSDLKIIMAGRDSGDDLVRFSMAFNSYSKQTFTRRVLYGVGNGTASSTLSTNTSVGYGTVRSGGTATTYGNVEIYIPNYASSNIKSFMVEGAEENNSVDAIMGISSGYTSNTDPIKSISIFNDAPYFAIGSRFSLYGITSVSNVTELTPKATGGDIIANDGEYWYHAFLSTGSFKPMSNLNSDILVIAGGGAGGAGHAGGAGGGGAGGLLALTNQLLTAKNSYTCTVGAGGAAQSSVNGAYVRIGNNGSNSQFGNLTAAIGGGGGAATMTDGANIQGNTGGSGGGTAFWNASSLVAGGQGTSGQGYSAGQVQGPGYTRGASGGGGAGGSSGAIGAANSYDSTAGGIGASYSSYAYATNTGVAGYYAGGGGGANAGSAKAGGAGGGGAGYGTSSTGTATSGTANTGGGGGGASADASGIYTFTSGAGGSGIVIVRYAMA